MPLGHSRFALDNSQPAKSVSPKGIGTANLPDSSKIENPSANDAPLPPLSAGTHASVNPDSSNAAHRVERHSLVGAEFRVCGSLKSSKILVVASIHKGTTSDIYRPL